METLRKKKPVIVALLVAAIATLQFVSDDATAPGAGKPPPPPLDATSGGAEDTWAVIVSTSRFWQNYRHSANALAVYWAARRSGIPDDRIVLMLAEDHACDARNPFPGTIFSTEHLDPSLYCASVGIDYSGDEVTATSFLRVLTGHTHPDVSREQQIFPTAASNVLVYITGHSGENFMKFHDYEFLTSYDVAQAFDRMHAAGRYRRLLFLVDTCQAETLWAHVRAPNVVAVGSSVAGEDSLSSFERTNKRMGVSQVDGFASELSLKFFAYPNETIDVPGPEGGNWGALYTPPPRGLTLGAWVRGFDIARVKSHVCSSHPLDGPVGTGWLLRDFFGPGAAAVAAAAADRRPAP